MTIFIQFQNDSMTWEERAESAPRTWDPIHGGRRGPILWDDDAEYHLGTDPTGDRFEAVARRMLGGDYYPPDAVRFWGKFRDEKRPLRVGDRILQGAPLFLSAGGPLLRSVAEVFVAERTEYTCEIGYVTTTMHFGRGIWRARLRRESDALFLRVTSTAMPGSLLFWLGLPIARSMQLRARRRAVEDLRAVGVADSLHTMGA
jgi:hypothetical protein